MDNQTDLIAYATIYLCAGVFAIVYGAIIGYITNRLHEKQETQKIL